MNIVTIIPARMASSRFPGKPMALINGAPMIEHVYSKSAQCRLVTKTIVATCDRVIFDHIESIGGLALMTSPNHERASDRCAEALKIYEKCYECEVDIVVMIQGDEPMVSPQMIHDALLPFERHSDVSVVNLMSRVMKVEDLVNENCVKVVVNRFSEAIYFSRNVLPSNTRNSEVSYYKQVCVIPFRREALLMFNSLEPTPLEVCESIDMLRFLENRVPIRMVEIFEETCPVDTPADLSRVAALMTSP